MSSPTASMCPNTACHCVPSERNALKMVKPVSAIPKKHSGPASRSPADIATSAPRLADIFSSATAAAPANIMGMMPESMARNGVELMIHASTLLDISPIAGKKK